MSTQVALNLGGDELATKLKLIRADLQDEYFADEPFPWIVGFSGGKDSTLVAHLVFEMLLEHAPKPEAPNRPCRLKRYAGGVSL